MTVRGKTQTLVSPSIDCARAGILITVNAHKCMRFSRNVVTDVDAAKSRYRCRRACRRVGNASTYSNSRSANLSRGKTPRGVARRAIRRINWSVLRRSEREGRSPADPALPMVVNDRYAKQSVDRTHFYTFQSEGQFNCGGRPIRASAIFSASNRPPETVNVCARTAPNDIYIYIDTALNGILNNGECLNAFATAA